MYRSVELITLGPCPVQRRTVEREPPGDTRDARRYFKDLVVRNLGNLHRRIAGNQADRVLHRQTKIPQDEQYYGQARESGKRTT